MGLAPFILSLSTSAGVTPPSDFTVPVPDGFRWTPPFSIFREGSTYYSDFDPADHDFSATTGVTYYFNNSTGSDANNGLSAGAPKKTIHTIITALNSSPPSGGATFILQTDYADIYSASTLSIGFDLVLKSSVAGTRRKFAKIVTDGITQVSEGSNVYSWARVAGIVNVLDYANLDSNGFPIRLTEVATEAAVDALAGSFWKMNGSKIYFRLFNNRAPDSNVKAFRSGAVLYSISTSTTKLYAQDIEFFGGHATSATAGGAANLVQDANSEFTACFYNCVFGYGFYGLEAWRGNSSTNGTKIFLKDCYAIYNSADGFNYHNTSGGSDADVSPTVYEENCQSYKNGWTMVTGSTSPNNNGSTMHDGGIIIRLNGSATQNENRNIHDVSDDTQVWILGYTAGSALNQASNDNSIDYVFGDNSTPQTVEAWLDGCDFSGNSLKNLRVNTGTVVKVTNMDFTGWDNVINGTLTEE